jgi:hypothetical protein
MRDFHHCGAKAQAAIAMWVSWATKLSSIPAGLFVFVIAATTFFALSAIVILVFFIMGQAVPERQPGDPMRRASPGVGTLTCSASATGCADCRSV